MKPKTSKKPESVVREIKRKTRRKFNFAEDYLSAADGKALRGASPSATRSSEVTTILTQGETALDTYIELKTKSGISSTNIYNASLNSTN